MYILTMNFKLLGMVSQFYLLIPETRVSCRNNEKLLVVCFTRSHVCIFSLADVSLTASHKFYDCMTTNVTPEN